MNRFVTWYNLNVHDCKTYTKLLVCIVFYDTNLTYNNYCVLLSQTEKSCVPCTIVYKQVSFNTSQECIGQVRTWNLPAFVAYLTPLKGLYFYEGNVLVKQFETFCFSKTELHVLLLTSPYISSLFTFKPETVSWLMLNLICKSNRKTYCTHCQNDK